jgi:6-phosphogluconolactonase
MSNATIASMSKRFMTAGYRAAVAWLACTPLAEAGTVRVWFGTGSPQAEGIYQSRLDTKSGQLAPTTLAATVDGPGFLALHPSGELLYAVSRVPGTNVDGVTAFRVADDTLSFVNGQGLVDGTEDDGGGAHLSVHPSGRFLVTAQYGGGTVAVFPLQDDGQIGPRSQLIEHRGGSGVVAGRQDSPHPHWTGFDRAGRFAFVPDLGLDRVVIYKVDPTAPSLSSHGEAAVPPGGGPRHMAFSPDGRFAYVLNELALSVTVFRYDEEAGTLEALQTEPALTNEEKAGEAFNSASEIRMHPTGRFVYSANRGHDSITVFRRDEDSGRLARVEVEPIRGSWPRNFNLDPGGRWLVAAGQNSNTVSVFAVDPGTGELTYDRGIINVPGPICVLFAE